MNTDQAIINFVDEYSNTPPSQFFLLETTKDATLARTMNHALYCIIDQLRNPISLQAESFLKWIVYKQSAVHRHQKFFGMFRTLNKSVKKYNDMDLVRRLNAVYKRAVNSGDNHYLFEPNALKYIGTAYIRRLFILEQIQKYCVKTANCCMGMLELEHWANLSLVIVALCGEIHSETMKQVQEMESTYKFSSKILKNVDERFPNSLEQMEVFERVRGSSGTFDKESVDISRITKLLKFTDEKISEAEIENKIDKLKNEVINDLLNLKTPAKHAEPTTSKVGLDYGVAVSRDDISALNFAITDEESLLSPMLFGKMKKNVNDAKKKKKFKNTEKAPKLEFKSSLIENITEKEMKDQNEDQKNYGNSFLASTLNLISEKSPEKKMKKPKKKLKKKIAASISNSSASSTVIRKIKKKKNKSLA